MKTKTICRHCKVNKGTSVDCKHLKPDGTYRHYYTCRECNTNRLKKYRNKNMKSIYQITKRYEEKNIGKRNVWRKVSKALRDGIITKPDKCSKCKKKAKLIDAHHEDYRKPLDITWLCRSCHVGLHKNK